MTRRRLDAELVRRGLVASSAAEAHDAVRAGLVRVGGLAGDQGRRRSSPTTSRVAARRGRRGASSPGAARSSMPRSSDSRSTRPGSTASTPAHRPAGSPTASSSGGAASVVAVDVGYGQLAWALRTDDRVTVLERTNVRRLRARTRSRSPRRWSWPTCRSSRCEPCCPRSRASRPATPRCVLLVKPQFEAGPAERERGAAWCAIPAVVAAARSTQVAGRCVERRRVAPSGVMASPVRGPAGNVEFLLWPIAERRPLTRGDLDAAVAEGERVAA